MQGSGVIILMTITSLILGFVLSCATPGAKEPTSLSAAEQEQLEEARAEIEIGRNMAGRLLRYYGAYPDEHLTRYVNEVGLFVAKHSDHPNRRYMFEIYNSETVNAFACPGGYILISIGAIKTASNEAELAHILAHEMAHVSYRHMYTTLQNMNEKDLHEAAEAGTNLGDLPPAMQIRKRPDPEQSAFGGLVARYLSGQAAGLSIIKAAAAGMSIILEKGLGAELEFEADRKGTEFAINAGYYPRALVNFLCRMETQRGRPKDYCLKPSDVPPLQELSVLDRTHPPVPARVSQINSVLLAMKAEDIVGAKGKKRFSKMKERIKLPQASSTEGPIQASPIEDEE